MSDSLFDRLLTVAVEQVELSLTPHGSISWLDYVLNPRRLRGSDFLMRWSQGVWSEDRILQAVNQGSEFFAPPYGPSGVAPDDDPRAFELYFERLEKAGRAGIKRPDLLVFSKVHQHSVEEFVQNVGGVQELPFTTEGALQELLERAILAVECENSLWVAEKMPDYGCTLKPQKWNEGRLGVKKSAVLPTIIIKEEDRIPLLDWQNATAIPIHVWHAFFDVAYGIALGEIERLIAEKLIVGTEQVFQAPSGATTRKLIYKIYYHYGYPLATSITKPELKAACIEDKNGHILPYVTFEGGQLKMMDEGLATLRRIRDTRGKA
jgi:AccI restriction endonuclease